LLLPCTAGPGREIGNVSLDGRHIAADLGDGIIQFRLPAARNEDIGSLFHEALGGSKSDTGAAAGMTAIFPCNAGMILISF
jgi:hypothetical protein